MSLTRTSCVFALAAVLLQTTYAGNSLASKTARSHTTALDELTPLDTKPKLKQPFEADNSSLKEANLTQSADHGKHDSPRAIHHQEPGGAIAFFGFFAGLAVLGACAFYTLHVRSKMTNGYTPMSHVEDGEGSGKTVLSGQ